MTGPDENRADSEENSDYASRKHAQRADLLLILAALVVIAVGVLVIFFP
jgi:hypothetical protein